MKTTSSRQNVVKIPIIFFSPLPFILQNARLLRN